LCFGVMLALTNGCLELYNPPTSKINYNYLVVDGFLNANDTSFIKLSLTQTLSSDSVPQYVNDAILYIEDDQSNTFPFVRTLSNGSYFLPPQTWNLTANYRIHINANGNEYLSDYVPIVQTPPIDSVTWKLETGENVQVQVNTHDPSNQAHYFLWTYVETWEYTPPIRSYFIIQNGMAVPRTDDIYHCWRTQPSTQIFLATSGKLSQDIISQFPLNLIGREDPRLQYKYSTLVSQQALSLDAYQYWLTLQKNTENLGTLFGPQPTQLTGNIHCVNSPTALALGYFSAGSVQEQRIFIARDQLPNTTHFLGYDDCTYSMIPAADVATYSGGDLLGDAIYQGIVLLGYETGTPPCIDCRYHGGVTTKPSFWGN
jgi:hypothetical protein